MKAPWPDFAPATPAPAVWSESCGTRNATAKASPVDRATRPSSGKSGEDERRFDRSFDGTRVKPTGGAIARGKADVKKHRILGRHPDHMLTRSRPDDATSIASNHRALRHTGLAKHRVDGVNAHGAGSRISTTT
jgi:hypothetical protein